MSHIAKSKLSTQALAQTGKLDALPGVIDTLIEAVRAGAGLMVPGQPMLVAGRSWSATGSFPIR